MHYLYFQSSWLDPHDQSFHLAVAVAFLGAIAVGTFLAALVTLVEARLNHPADATAKPVDFRPPRLRRFERFVASCLGHVFFLHDDRLR